MLKYIKLNLPRIESSIYEVRVESSDLFIGELIKLDDGFYYFSPDITKDRGLWSDYTLIAIGIKLKELNQPWTYQINTELSK
jgi:hypothetical protein